MLRLFISLFLMIFVFSFSKEEKKEKTIFIDGQFLYLQPIQEGMDIGTYDTLSPNTAKIIHVGDEYKPSFRVGFGSKTQEKWTNFIHYTWIHTKETVEKSASGLDFIVANWLDSDNRGDLNDVRNKAKGEWDLKMDLLDLSSSRALLSFRHIFLDAFFGLRGGWIRQNYDPSYLINEHWITSYNRSKSWLIGPRGGLELAWFLLPSVKCFTDLSFAVIYQDFDVKNRQEDVDNPSTTFATFKNHFSQLTTNFNLELGIGWKGDWKKDRLGSLLTAGYFFEYFSHQNQIRALKDSLSDHNDGNKGDLFLHGLKIILGLSF